MVVVVAFAVVFLAEFGDKTQVVTLALAARYGPWPVLAGVTMTTALLNLVSVTVGTVLAQQVPTRAVTAGAGVAFLVFAVWSGRDFMARLPPDGRSSGLRVAASSAGLFAVSEIGDKTMLATIALAAHANALLVWAGSTAGIVAAEAVAVLVGSRVANRLSPSLVRIGSAVLFATLGVGLLVAATT